VGDILISVVVCTHNRAKILRQALESLALQSLDRQKYEIVVVDNRSSDRTQMVIREFEIKEPSCRLTLMYEPTLGLSHARNAGWGGAKGAFVAFMDDDAKADAHWLEWALESFRDIKPSPVAVGGPIFPYYISQKPSWFKDEYELRSWGKSPRWLSAGETFSGSNMIIRRDILEALGGFDVRVGMKGKRISVGEETALFQKLWDSGRASGALHYSPRLVIYHAVGGNKLRAFYHVRRAFVAGQVWYLQNGPKMLRERARFIRQTIRAIGLLGASAFKGFRSYHDYHNWVVESIAPLALEVGRLLGGFGASVPVWQGRGPVPGKEAGVSYQQAD
jgi:glucosyl-dolichyl phosphate glucuronosyltransferase